MVRISVYIYLLFSTFSVVGFFLPLYLQDKGLDAGQIGTTVALGSLVSMFAQPFWGYMSDKKKTIKRVLMVLMCGCILSSIGFFSMNTVLLIMLFFMLLMFFSTASGPLTETLCISYAQENNKEYGRLRLWGELGVGTSALMLGFVIEGIGVGYLWAIYLTLMGTALCAGLLLRDSKATPKPVDLKALGKLFAKPRLLIFLLLIMLVGIPHRMNDTLLSLYLEQLDAPESLLGMAWLVATMSTVPALLMVGKLIKRYNELAILVIAAVCYAVRWGIYSITDSPIVLICAQALHSLTFPLFLVASITYLGSLVPSELRATGQAAFAVTFGGLAGMIGSAGGGYAFDAIGPEASYGIGGGLALLGAAAAMGIYVYNKRNPDRSDASTIAG